MFIKDTFVQILLVTFCIIGANRKTEKDIAFVFLSVTGQIFLISAGEGNFYNGTVE